MSDLQPPKPPSPVESHRSNVGRGTYNRYEALFPGGVSSQLRTPTRGKRPLENDDSSASIPKMPRFDADKVFDQLKSHDSLILAAKASLKEACDTAGLFCKVDDNALGTVLFKLTQVCDTLLKGQETLKSSIIDALKSQKQGPSFAEKVAAVASGNKKTPKPQISPADAARIKVKKVLREAERRALVFDLNLGSAPVMNKDTISRQVTTELHSRAKEGKHDWDLKSAATMVDDMLSCAQLEFLGSGTRRFFNNRNNNDERNNKMCTVPVRFDFKNKEQRIKAEHTLKRICNARCSIPYPKKLRAMLADMLKEGKTAKPNQFIMTKVDIDNLKVSLWARSDNGWQDLKIVREISTDILDNNTVTLLDDDMESESQQVS